LSRPRRGAVFPAMHRWRAEPALTHGGGRATSGRERSPRVATPAAVFNDFGASPVDKTELAKLQAYLRRKFDLDTIKVVARPKKKDSAEMFIDDEFVAVIYRDEEDGEISWNLQMAILEMDLED
jgi:hypothetical protein